MTKRININAEPVITAEVIADSISGNTRLISLQLKYPRFILAEFNTHRVFSRSTSSSRAIPVKKMIEQIRENPTMPIHWGENQAGMQAGKEIEEKYTAMKLWDEAAQNACAIASEMNVYGLHKQVVNRILEPFMYVSTIVTATEWDNFFGLRLHPDAQPEIQELARVMKQAMDNSEPVNTPYHLPYITKGEVNSMNPYDSPMGNFVELAKISSARCARVSYLKHDGTKPSIEDDSGLYAKLSSMKPMHASPMEHQAVFQSDDHFFKNFRGWKQFRQIIEECKSENNCS